MKIILVFLCILSLNGYSNCLEVLTCDDKIQLANLKGQIQKTKCSDQLCEQEVLQIFLTQLNEPQRIRIQTAMFATLGIVLNEETKKLNEADLQVVLNSIPEVETLLSIKADFLTLLKEMQDQHAFSAFVHSVQLAIGGGNYDAMMDLANKFRETSTLIIKKADDPSIYLIDPESVKNYLKTFIEVQSLQIKQEIYRTNINYQYSLENIKNIFKPVAVGGLAIYSGGTLSYAGLAAFMGGMSIAKDHINAANMFFGSGNPNYWCQLAEESMGDYFLTEMLIGALGGKLLLKVLPAMLASSSLTLKTSGYIASGGLMGLTADAIFLTPAQKFSVLEQEAKSSEAASDNETARCLRLAKSSIVANGALDVAFLIGGLKYAHSGGINMTTAQAPKKSIPRIVTNEMAQLLSRDSGKKVEPTVFRSLSDLDPQAIASAKKLLAGIVEQRWPPKNNFHEHYFRFLLEIVFDDSYRANPSAFIAKNRRTMDISLREALESIPDEINQKVISLVDQGTQSAYFRFFYSEAMDDFVLRLSQEIRGLSAVPHEIHDYQIYRMLARIMADDIFYIDPKLYLKNLRIYFSKMPQNFSYQEATLTWLENNLSQPPNKSQAFLNMLKDVFLGVRVDQRIARADIQVVELSSSQTLSDIDSGYIKYSYFWREDFGYFFGWLTEIATIRNKKMRPNELELLRTIFLSPDFRKNPEAFLAKAKIARGNLDIHYGIYDEVYPLLNEIRSLGLLDDLIDDALKINITENIPNSNVSFAKDRLYPEQK